MLGLGILLNNLISRYISSPLDIIFNKVHSSDELQPLFKKQKLIISSITSSQLIKCAVDDFDFIHNDFQNDQIPFDWDINNLIELPSYHHSHQFQPTISRIPSQQPQHFEEFEATLDEELTFVDRSKMFVHQEYLQQQQLQSQQQQLQLQLHLQQHEQALEQEQLNHHHQHQNYHHHHNHHHNQQQQHQSNQTNKTIKEEFPIDLNDVNSMFDNSLLENELSFLLNPHLVEQEADIKPVLLNNSNTKPRKTLKSKKKPKDPKPTVFQCSHCPASFKVKGYLTRHLKKHSPSKLFVCPFFSSSSSLPSPLSTRSSPSSVGSSSISSSSSSSFTTTYPAGTKCHPTGGFSRRDTFKTHLKALHFIYPPGTKSNSRSQVGGRCAGCFAFFKNNSAWLNDHIEKNECPNMLHSF